MNETLRNKLAELPDSPGVYIMKDALGTIIYVGKAVILKNRVRQYFFHTQKQPKVQAMVDNVADFEYIMTLSERDALALEANLIKKHKPRYNILLKDDKAFPYIKIDLRETYPTIEVTRKPKRDGAKYFGPYFNGIGVYDVVDIIRSAYRMRTCPKKFTGKTRACLNYHIDLCTAPCQGFISPEDYRCDVVDRVLAFLSGRDDLPDKLITEKMNAAAANEDFERAIFYRDRLAMLERMRERTLADLGSVVDIDAFQYATNGVISVVSVTIVRAGKLMGVRNYTATEAHLSPEEALSSFVTQYYGTLNIELPQEICFPCAFDTAALESYLASLSDVKTQIVFPKRGTRKKLLDTAEKNARDYLEKNADKARRKENNTVGAAKLLGEILRLGYVRRIECYDISNISGVDKVASMVVFTDGEADNAEYRRFRIKTVEGSDDFASMAEVLRRRFERLDSGDEKFARPDLIVIDGGKGQLSAAYTAMRGVGYDVPMVGLAKREEEVFTVFDDLPIVLPRDNVALKLLQRIRDEAHRFAITYHRSLRAKRYYSELESIRGVGASKCKKLLQAFKYNEIKTATVEELSTVIDRATAENVYRFYHSEEN